LTPKSGKSRAPIGGAAQRSVGNESQRSNKNAGTKKVRKVIRKDLLEAGASSANSASSAAAGNGPVTPKQKPTVKEVFKQLDKDGSGTISVEELRASLNESGENVSLQEVKEAMTEIDASGDGEISYAEFSKLWHGDSADGEAPAPKPMALSKGLDKELVKSFAMFDTDGSGTISVDELNELLKKEGRAPISDDEIAVILEKFDTDGDGQISIKEFANMLQLGEGGPTATPPPETSKQMADRAAKYHKDADAEEERSRTLPNLMSRLGVAIKASGKKPQELAHEWDANEDGDISLQEWRVSMRKPKMMKEIDSSDVIELDDLFRQLDTDGSGSLSIEEVKGSIRKCQAEYKRVTAEQEKIKIMVEHLRKRAQVAIAAEEATVHYEELGRKWVDVEIMLGKDKPPAPGESIGGSLGPRMYASMMKRGNKISELANTKSGLKALH